MNSYNVITIQKIIKHILYLEACILLEYAENEAKNIAKARRKKGKDLEHEKSQNGEN